MEFFVVFILCTIAFVVWQYMCYKRDMILKAAVTDFMSKIVLCKVEQRDGQYYLYHEITKKFLAQGKTPSEVQQNLPNDGWFYLSQDGHREILEELIALEEKCTPLKST